MYTTDGGSGDVTYCIILLVILLVLLFLSCLTMTLFKRNGNYVILC